ncbi:hypothetical protein HCN44_004319 [Aphidius gifuensis]|uniref:Histone-lysine N-methyltransferase eggless n=1 Tax=Aphidius gifuensis TaxID=684658 RepID=A0A835CSZ9_APHGI|nr:histone-lysine N-methyltransferase eggless-like [Aphidius gifuensis]KAF7994847.1 hypothetical protein HCN44_004319 [Aphidius gifuensis]
MSNGQKNLEIIDLGSDSEDKNSTDKQTSINHTMSCINFNCKSGVNMKIASTFACSYYGVNTTKKKRRFICEKCYEAPLVHQETLAVALLERKPMFECPFPDESTTHINLSDSDSDSEDSKNDFIPEDVLIGIENKFANAMVNVLKKCDIHYQQGEAYKFLKTKFDRIDDDYKLLDDELDVMIKKMDSLRNTFYDQYKPPIRYQPVAEFEDTIIQNSQPPSSRILSPPALSPIKMNNLQSSVATKKVTQVRKPHSSSSSSSSSAGMINHQFPQDITQVEVMPVEQRDRASLSQQYGLPPHGQLVRRPAEVDNIVLVMKNPLMAWIKAKVQSIVSKSPMTYRVKFIPKRFNNQVKNMCGKEIALFQPATVIIPVSTRVVAIFNDIQASNYFSGVIAEPPKATNKFRYLVFFDDGYAQYVAHKQIFVVTESSSRVWEDVPVESRDFIKKYLDTYPERPLVKLEVGQVVKTEWMGKWWIARVIQVDASLVQMHFDADGRTEWIYRGSQRLGPLYLEFAKAKNRQQGHHAPVNKASRHISGPLTKANINQPYVEYTSGIGDFEIEETINKKTMSGSMIKFDNNNKIQGTSSIRISPSTSTNLAPPVRAVARKSTGKKPIPIAPAPAPSYDLTYFNESKPSHSIVYYQTQHKIRPREYVPHDCGPNCINGISYTPDDLKGFSPLSIPLLCGWNRQLCKYSKGKKVEIYQAPCGLRLRNLEEVHKYLRVTKSTMSVDLFDFDHWVHCLAEFVLDKCFVNIKDLSYGVENVLIPCVNEIDHALPDTITYSTKREPTEGVNLNLDPNFLCCCDCEDDCADKTKCQCWQLTIQGAPFGGRTQNNNVGYVYKRLPEPVSTGIYECNSNCKCSVKTCLNRVVQHPLTLKLQVFKTAPRGWGIRCLNDIPLGSFICIYAGRLLTEQGANEGGKNYGDEYLAELDYVEVVEAMKADYESEAIEPELPIDESVDPPSPSDKLQPEEQFTTSPKKKGSYESDEEFNINQYNNEYSRLDTETDESMKKRLRKRKKSDETQTIDGPDEKSEDGTSSKSSDNIKEASDEEEQTTELMRQPRRFEPIVELPQVERPKFKSVRDFYGADEAVYIMDAKTTGNIGRYLNHSCDPNVFVQNVFVDTHDVRFPWVAFFALNFIRAGQELTWNYSYDVGSIPGKVILCRCGASNCRGRLL